MKFFLTFLILLSFSSQAAYFCGVVEKIDANNVTYNLVDDSGAVTNLRETVLENSKTLSLARLIENNSMMKLCTNDHDARGVFDSQYITNLDNLVK